MCSILCVYPESDVHVTTHLTHECAYFTKDMRLVPVTAHATPTPHQAPPRENRPLANRVRLSCAQSRAFAMVNE